MTLEEFKTMLEKHDWYYNYADSGKEYTKGRAERNQIEAALAELTTLGLREEACQIYNDIAPDDFYRIR